MGRVEFDFSQTINIQTRDHAACNENTKCYLHVDLKGQTRSVVLTMAYVDGSVKVTKDPRYQGKYTARYKSQQQKHWTALLKCEL